MVWRSRKETLENSMTLFLLRDAGTQILRSGGLEFLQSASGFLGLQSLSLKPKPQTLNLKPVEVWV